MTDVAPTDAPEETPRMSGSARELRTSAWMAAPTTERPSPTKAPIHTRLPVVNLAHMFTHKQKSTSRIGRKMPVCMRTRQKNRRGAPFLSVPCFPHIPILVGKSVIASRQVSWLGFIAPCTFPSRQTGETVAVAGRSRYSGGTASDFHRTSLL